MEVVVGREGRLMIGVLARLVRMLIFASLVLAAPRQGDGQTVSVLHIKVVLVDAARNVTPVQRHVLLVSDNPASTAPRRVVTAPDGTASVKLPPGNYTVESDRPVAFQGKEYQWTETLDVSAGRDTVLELTADNAQVGPISSASASAGSSRRADPSDQLMQWQDSVVALWTPSTHASGFVIDSAGLIATNQRVVGTATSVEVQLTPTVKVAALVLAADSARDVALLWIDPNAVASIAPVPLGCALPLKPAVVSGQEIFAFGTPLQRQTRLTSGAVIRVQPQVLAADFDLAFGSAGGPVFNAAGGVVGLTSPVDGKERSRGDDARVVRIDAVCDVVASAAAKMKGAAAPSGTHLPVEPLRSVSADVLKDAATRRAGSLSPYLAASSDFDIAFITPVVAYGGQRQATDFSNWSEYVADFPPVLLVRVTPKQVEKFWTTVARGVAMTQGVALPPVKRFKPGFARMRAFCGDAEVTPIHPLLLERRVSDTDAVHEGLYVFDPDALGPHCGTVTLEVFSEKATEKKDTGVVDLKVLQQIWQDFESYRAQK